MQQVYEKLEHQRRNPHLYTTPTQSVNFDGSITTYEQVTSKLKESLDKLEDYHLKRFGTKECGGMCNYQFDDLCKIISIHHEDMRKAALSFVENYKYMVDRTTSRDD